MPILYMCTICGALSDEHRCDQHRRARTGRGRSGWGWARTRRRVLDRDQHRCIVCGSTERLEVHHVNGDPTDDRLSNLRTYCHRHHPRGDALPAGARRAPVPDPGLFRLR